MAHFTKPLVLFLLAVSASAASAQAPICTDPNIACTQQGAVRGVIEGDTLAFKGFPTHGRPSACCVGGRLRPLRPGQVCATVVGLAQSARRSSGRRSRATKIA